MPAAAMEVPTRDLEGGPPHPSVDVLDCFSSPQGLREGLGHGVAGKLRIATEQEYGTPQPRAVLPVAALDGGRLDHGGRTTHPTV